MEHATRIQHVLSNQVGREVRRGLAGFSCERRAWSKSNQAALFISVLAQIEPFCPFQTL